MLLARVGELHEAWWEAVWSEIAWDEHCQEPAGFALTIKESWDRFNRVAKILECAGFSPGILVVEFEARGDPKATTAADHAAMAEKARCGS